MLHEALHDTPRRCWFGFGQYRCLFYLERCRHALNVLNTNMSSLLYLMFAQVYNLDMSP